MKEITSNTSVFEDLTKGNYLYVDKTEYIWNLVKSYRGFFFLVFRRFGKALTVSTLEAVFRGDTDFFKRLAIYNKPYGWKKYPIIHLELGKGIYSSLEQTSSAHSNIVSRCAHEYGIELKRDIPNEMFQDLIILLKEKKNRKIEIPERERYSPSSSGTHTGCSFRISVFLLFCCKTVRSHIHSFFPEERLYSPFQDLYF